MIYTPGAMNQSEPGKAGDRRQRLAEALRANLKRRKSQKRGRETPPADTGNNKPARSSSSEGPAGEST